MRAVFYTLAGLLLLQIGTFALWWIDLKMGSLQAQQALAAANSSYGILFWVMGIGVGLVLPLVIGLLLILQSPSNRRKFEVPAIALGSAMIVIGAFCFRLAVVLAGQETLPMNLAL